ncbi:SagB family peptide dehydrogenase [Prauserella endophytica]|uniref:SagB/ThcOx family dehydrogenase n=1 Tax=Prauserella endophytica TaxID=1592324 RepID=A0ABY2S965_9PSEU|nr:SagB family peptide dehydrogenase [Prauserella endophytica]TKG71986.1 SagB/ThcOx family dehydrogenase [Prauserella endophytica]
MGGRETTERALAVHRLLNSQSPDSARPLPHGRRFPLPDVHPPQADLVATLARRRSSYAYADRDLQLTALSAWLRFSVGVQRFVPAFGVADYPLGMAPSAGGLDILRAYLVVRRAEQIDPGVYRYEAVSHELVELSDADPVPALEHVYLQPEFIPRAAVSLALTARLDVAFDKYPLRHYRTLHVDTGVAVQNLYLVGTALGLACCAVAGFDDAALGTLLGVTETEIPTMLFAAGHAATQLT